MSEVNFELVNGNQTTIIEPCHTNTEPSEKSRQKNSMQAFSDEAKVILKNLKLNLNSLADRNFWYGGGVTYTIEVNGYLSTFKTQHTIYLCFNAIEEMQSRAKNVKKIKKSSRCRNT